MTVHIRSGRGRQSRAVILVFLLLFVARATVASDNSAAAQSTTQPVPSKPAKERDRDRLLAIRAATIAAHEYAKAHEQKIPTTEQLAEQMGIASQDFQYRVVPSGSWDQHLKRVKGDWPEVLITEKNGGGDGKWAFGFVDGMCILQSVEAYKEHENSGALQVISEATTKPSSAP